MTHFWREYKNFYRLQTDNKKIHAKLKRREGADLCGEGINFNLWIYRLEYTSPRNAKRGIKRIMGTNNTFILLTDD
jgi:hypothetical protein